MERPEHHCPPSSELVTLTPSCSSSHRTNAQLQLKAMALLIALLLSATDAERQVRGTTAGWWHCRVLQAPQCLCHWGALLTALSCQDFLSQMTEVSQLVVAQ